MNFKVLYIIYFLRYYNGLKWKYYLLFEYNLMIKSNL